MPWPIQVAIEQAITILSWHENLNKEDVPPEHLWEDSEGLDMWFASVEDRKSDGRSETEPKDRVSVPDPGGDEEADGHQEPGMAENDIARFLKR